MGVKPHKIMRGHTDTIQGIARLPGGRRIITCSSDGSLRIWDLKSGKQIGNDWRDWGDDGGVYTIALSPNCKVIASGGSDRKVRLWDIETGKVIAKWTGHSDIVWRVCWSADGERLASGSRDGMVRVWDVNGRGQAVGSINMRAGHDYVTVIAVIYSPDMTMLATGRLNDHAIRIWDSETCELLSTVTVNHKDVVFSLAWTSDQKKLISGSQKGQIRIFDTATWRQTALLLGHQDIVHAISLFHNRSNGRLLASASYDRTARLWDLDTNLSIGPPLQHEDHVFAIAISADEKLLVTCCGNNVYIWDIHTIIKNAGIEVLPSIPDKVALGNSLVDTNATRGPARLTSRKNAYRLPQAFLGARDGDRSSAMPGTNFHSSACPHIFHRSHPSEATALQPPQSVSSHYYSRAAQFPAAQNGERLYVTQRPERADYEWKRYAAGTRSQSPITIENPTWWTRLVFLICCVSSGQPQS